MARWPVALVSLVVGGLVGALVITTSLQAQLQGQGAPPPVFPKELTSYRELVKRVLPAVVSVESKPKPKAVAQSERPSQSQQRRFGNLPPGMPEQFRRFFEEFNDGQETPDMMERPSHSFGSGVVVDAKGIILTNFHVVNGTDRVEVTLNDGRKFLSTDIKGDRKNDLAIVRIKVDRPLPYLEMGDSDAMEIGDRVLAIGAPFGLTGSVTSGIVSAKGRSNIEKTDRAVYEDYLQTDAAINPGNSGGPLVNLEGRIIGINTAIKSVSGGWQGIGLAITSNVAKNIVDQLERNGVVHRGYLGVSVGPLEPDAASQLGVPNGSGVVIARVFPKTPASKAGLQAGDVLLRVGDHVVNNGRELQHVIGTMPTRKPVDLTVIRDGKTKVMPVTIEEQPEDYGVNVSENRPSRQPNSGSEEMSADKVGLTLSELTAETAEKFGFDESVKGILITKVENGSIAADAGLRRGVVIAKIDKKAVTSAAAAQAALQKANLTKGVLLQVQLPPAFGGGTNYIVLKAETADK